MVYQKYHFGYNNHSSFIYFAMYANSPQIHTDINTLSFSYFYEITQKQCILIFHYYICILRIRVSLGKKYPKLESQNKLLIVCLFIFFQKVIVTIIPKLNLKVKANVIP